MDLLISKSIDSTRGKAGSPCHPFSHPAFVCFSKGSEAQLESKGVTQFKKKKKKENAALPAWTVNNREGDGTSSP